MMQDFVREVEAAYYDKPLAQNEQAANRERLKRRHNCRKEGCGGGTHNIPGSLDRKWDGDNREDYIRRMTIRDYGVQVRNVYRMPSKDAKKIQFMRVVVCPELDDSRSRRGTMGSVISYGSGAVLILTAIAALLSGRGRDDERSRSYYYDEDGNEQCLADHPEMYWDGNRMVRRPVFGRLVEFARRIARVLRRDNEP